MRSVLALHRRLPRWLRRLSSDNSGIAAIEFALIMPLMMVMFFGMIDVSMGVGADRKVTMIAQTMADLPSRYTAVTDTDFTNFFMIGDAMLTPFAAGDLTVRISQVYIDPSNGKGVVYWSKGDVPWAVNTPIAVPAGLIGMDSTNKIVLPNQYLILAEVTFAYKPIIGYVVPKAGITLSESTYTRPRQSVCVYYSTANNCK